MLASLDEQSRAAGSLAAPSFEAGFRPVCGKLTSHSCMRGAHGWCQWAEKLSWSPKRAALRHAMQ